MKIKIKQDFRDRSADLALRKKGEVLDVSEQRAKELIAKGNVTFHPVNRAEPAVQRRSDG